MNVYTVFKLFQNKIYPLSFHSKHTQRNYRQETITQGSTRSGKIRTFDTVFFPYNLGDFSPRLRIRGKRVVDDVGWVEILA